MNAPTLQLVPNPKDIEVPASSGGGTLSRKRLRRYLRHEQRDRPRGHFPWYPYYYHPYTYAQPTSVYLVSQPLWYQPETCPSPLADGCTKLQMTARWATSCFMPRFHYLRTIYGDDAVALASAIAREEAPDCPFPPQSGAAAEYERRVKLAVAVLLNAHGVPVPYPAGLRTPRPPGASSVRQPWMRALLTGWV